MMSRVPRLRAVGEALFGSLAHALRGPRRAPLTEQGRFRVPLALAFALVMNAPALAEDAAQPDRSVDEPQRAAAPHPGSYRVMVRYPKPVMHNGKLVLWHGAWRDGEGARPIGHPRPGRAAAVAQPTAPAAPEPAAAKPAARTLSILADSADPTALRLAGELAGPMNGDDAQVKITAGVTSRAGLAKAISSDSADFALVTLDAFVDPVDGADWRQR